MTPKRWAIAAALFILGVLCLGWAGFGAMIGDVISGFWEFFKNLRSHSPRPGTGGFMSSYLSMLYYRFRA